MINYNSPIVQNMVNNGQLPYNQPMYYDSGYQQYNNIIPIGQIGYNQPQPNNNYVFRPTVQQQNYYDPYGCNSQSVYNPYANYNQGYNNQQYNPYVNYNQGYNYYNNYYGGIIQSRDYYEKQKRENLELLKQKYRIAGAWYGKEYTEEELDKMVNPDNPVNRPTRKELAVAEEYKRTSYYMQLMQQPPLETNAMRTARAMRDISYNFHKEFDGHGLCQFLEEDLWKLQREEWIRENLNPKTNGRDLSRTYNREDYNELLNMHRSSNPYINELLDTSRYDNNLDDMEIGLPQILSARKSIYEQPVPKFISSDEAQKRRHEFTSEILKSAMSKGVV